LKFFFFWFLFKNSFSSLTFSTVYYFSSFLDKDIYLWQVPQVGPFTVASLRVFFAFSGFFEFCFFFFPFHFIFVNSSRAHIGFGNGGFLFSFTPCLLSFLPCLFCFSPCYFFSFIPITKVTRLRCLRRYEATKLRSLTTL